MQNDECRMMNGASSMKNIPPCWFVMVALVLIVLPAPADAAPCGSNGTYDFEPHTIRVKALGTWYDGHPLDQFNWEIAADTSKWPNTVELEVVWKHLKNVASSDAVNYDAYNHGDACLNGISVGTTKQAPNIAGAMYAFQIPKTAKGLKVKMTTTLANSSFLFSYNNVITIKHLVHLQFSKVLIETPTQNQVIAVGSPVQLKLKPMTAAVDPTKISTFRVDWEWYWTAAEQVGSKNPLPAGWNPLSWTYKKWNEFPFPVDQKNPRKYRVRVTPQKADGSNDGIPTPWTEFTIVP
jgi:hypothetical protein